jgi:type I restriction enzyme S subunit
MSDLTGFKETEVGPTPVDWGVVPLSRAAEHKKATINPQSYPDEVFDYYSIPAYQISDKPALERGSEIRSQKLVVELGMVLFGKLNPRVPKVWRVVSTSSRRKIASTEFIPLVPIDGRISSEFLYYLAWSDYVLPKSQELVSGSTPSRQRVDVKAFLRIPIPLPPLPEQHRIARVLSTIQRAIAAQDDLIAAAREVKRSLMQRLFTYGPSPEPAPTKETEIGEIPEHWDAVALEEVADLEYGVQAAVAHLTDDAVGIPILTNVNITLEGDLDLSTLRYYELPEKWKHKQLQKGDVLFNWRSGSEHHVGKTAIFNLTGEYTFSSFILRFRSTSDALRPEYLAKYLHHLKASGFFMRMRQQSSVNKVFNKSESARITVPLPSPSEQQEITLPIAAAESKIAAEEQRKAALQALFKAMLHQLMTGQVRVSGIVIEGY